MKETCEAKLCFTSTLPGIPRRATHKPTKTNKQKNKNNKKDEEHKCHRLHGCYAVCCPRTPCWLRLHPEWRMQPTSGGCNPEGNGDQSWEMCFTFKTICYTGFNSLRLASISHRSFLCPIFHLSIFEEESCLLNQLLKTD